MCKISANAQKSANLQKMGKSAINLQSCNDFNVVISIYLEIRKKSANAQNSCKCAKNLQINKKSAKQQKINEFAKKM